MKGKPTTIDEYLAGVAPAQRAALQKLRGQIARAVPEAQECISYGIPTFRLAGKPLIAFGAGKNHCSLYPTSSATTAQFAGELKDFPTSKGAIRFQPDKPLPAALVRRLVKARMAENAARLATSDARAGAPGQRAVDDFIRRLNHPCKPALEALRRAIVGISPKVTEGIKWNSPSFRTSQWFATINVHRKGCIRLILHRGAKARAGAVKVPDPAGLLQWLGKDRAMVMFTPDGDLKPRLAALQALLRHWIKHV